jgi:hypothetical protein
LDHKGVYKKIFDADMNFLVNDQFGTRGKIWQLMGFANSFLTATVEARGQNMQSSRGTFS